MQLAPVSRKDLPALAELVQVSVPSLKHVNAPLLEQQTFMDPEHDISFLLQAIEKNKVIGFVLGTARKGAQGKQGFIKVFAVHPRYQGQGHAAVLFSELERRFRKREVHEIHTGRCPEPSLVSGIPLDDTDTVSFLMHRGYQPMKTIMHMSANLEDFKAGVQEDDAALLKELELRAVKEEEIKTAIEFAAALPAGSAWQLRFAAHKGIFIVALKKKKISGVASALFDSDTQLATFGPMAVDPELSKQGLKQLLLRQVLSELKKNKKTQLLFPDVGPVPFYRKYAGATLGPFFLDLVKRV